MRYAGGGRRVYPGFVQLSAFMSMNSTATARRTSTSTRTSPKAAGEGKAAPRPSTTSISPCWTSTAEFYLETVAWVFQEARLAKRSS